MPKPILTEPLKTLPPNTTLADDLVTAGQRRINLVWEVTQSMIAIMITLAIIYTSVTKTPAEVLINSFFLIIGFYFSRTNHTQTGGVGQKQTDTQKYEGR